MKKNRLLSSLSLGLIAAVLMIIVLAKRNFDLKQSMNKYPDDMRIIQNVKEGGVIKIANLDEYDTDLELKVVGRNLYMEGDYSWNHSAGEYMNLYKRLFNEIDAVTENEPAENPVVVKIESIMKESEETVSAPKEGKKTVTKSARKKATSK